eukprot:Plantae.Rhodophyta-Hildenbrandia_rubra.ctg8157.p1 GENE.Plantae.Rhodophyta-Hildenbrandia_rubra.ctg8157~~Plantae.Rhodophyta-Hildenbrandia_rubra.ctg8157.p1  ORF type:complete len:573 (+),score=95.36 Plantae.Rhodophyta-Hildenbrandia_rubra.ctg8157:141-1721(+)
MVVLSGALDVDDALLVIDNKIKSLEAYALKKKGLTSLPPLSSSRRLQTYRTQRALFNAIEAAVVRLENIASASPQASLQVRSHIHAQEIDYDPGARFEQMMGPLYVKLLEAGRKVGGLAKDFGKSAEVVRMQTEKLGSALKGTGILISKAATMAKPQDPAALKKECEELIDSAEEVSDLRHDVDLKSPLRYHGQALSDFAASLGWVVSPTTQKYVRSYKGIVSGSTESILASYIDLGLNPIHSDFASALDAMADALVEYVVKEHPAGLRWNYAKGAVPKGYKRASRKLTENSHPFGDYDHVINRSVIAYYCTSQILGGRVFKQAEAVLAAFTSMSEVIERCSNRSRPAGSVDAELKMVLQPVTHDLVPVVKIAKDCPSDYKYKPHLNAIVEFAQCMQWCTALVHKMSPVGFIIDIEGVTSLCLKEIVKDFGSGTSYPARVHKEWANNVQSMMEELKTYVKSHHPNELMFDTRRRRKSVDSIFERTRVSKKLDALRKKSTSRKWERGTLIKTVKGKKKRVKGWERIS